MNDTLVTLVGNAATAVEYRETATGGMARFRFAVTPRRWDREKQLWTDGRTSFYTVWAWRALASNLSGSVAVGEPLVVHGRLKVREEEREGRHRTFVDVEAVAVGHDLTRGTSAFRRVMRGGPGIDARTESALPGGAGGAGGVGGASARADEPDWSGVALRQGAAPGAETTFGAEAAPGLEEWSRSGGAPGPGRAAGSAEAPLPGEAPVPGAAAGREGPVGSERRADGAEGGERAERTERSRRTGRGEGGGRAVRQRGKRVTESQKDSGTLVLVT